jgi:glycosyltransferase involved in cell wall biosynthesis
VKILIDIGRLGRGGAERQVAQLASGLAARGHRCVLSVHKSVDAYAGTVRRAGVVVEALGRMGKYDPRILPDLLALTHSFRPDVVLAVEFNATLWGRLAAVLGGYPCVTAEHASKVRFPAPVVVTNRVLSPFTRATVACAQAQVPRLVTAGSRAGAMVVIHNGVDTSEFFPDLEGARGFRDAHRIPRDAQVIGLIAAHRTEKRHDRFIRLVEDLGVLGVDAWGCMVGGGPLLDQDRQMARRSSVADRLVATGPVDEVRAAYSAMDVVVLVSDWETFPLSLLEAQACARPVVSLDVGGARETFLPARSGVLVRPGDGARLAREVAALLKDERRLRTMGDHGRAWVEAALPLDAMVERYESLLERVATGWRPGA